MILAREQSEVVASLTAPPCHHESDRGNQQLLPASAMIKTPRLLRHIVPAMVISRSSPAPAAYAFIIAAATPAAIFERAQFLEHFAVLPDFIKGRIVYIPQLHIEVSTGLYLAPRADDAIAKACQTATMESRLNAQLVSDAQELWRAGRF